MVHNSKALLKSLESFILQNVVAQRSAFDVSGVKADGTVFVRFRSTDTASATQLAFDFIDHLSRRRARYTQTDDHKFRLPIDQFGSVA